MDLHAAAELLDQEMERHGLSALGWKADFDEARRRFGVCKPGEKTISLSRPLVLLNPEDEVRDTILHEIAHALAWERHREPCGHDQRWKDICVEIGARPERCFNDDVIQPDAPWVVCHRDTGEIYHSYLRKPSGDFSRKWIAGLKDETLGKLVVRPNPSLAPKGEILAFDSHSALALREEILAAIRPIAEARGLTVRAEKASYSKRELSLQFGVRIRLPEGVNPEKDEFELLAPVFQLSPDDYLRPFRIQGIRYRLAGFKLKNRKYPIIGVDVTGQRFKFGIDVLDLLEDR